MGDQDPDKKIDHLTPEYYKARRGLMLFSGLLIAWELIGIELSPKFNIDPLNLDITIKSPQAAPAVLIILIIYFSIRTAIEWHQSHPERRKEKASVADIFLTATVVIASLIIITIQFLLKIQIADIFDASSMMAFIFSIFIGYLVYYLFYFYRQYARLPEEEKFQEGEATKFWLSIFSFFLPLFSIIVVLHLSNWNLQKEVFIQNNKIILPSLLITSIFSISGLILGAIIALYIFYFLKKRRNNNIA